MSWLGVSLECVTWVCHSGELVGCVTRVSWLGVYVLLYWVPQ